MSSGPSTNRSLYIFSGICICRTVRATTAPPRRAECRVVGIEAFDELLAVNVALIVRAAVPHVGVPVDDEDLFTGAGLVHDLTASDLWLDWRGSNVAVTSLSDRRPRTSPPWPFCSSPSLSAPPIRCTRTRRPCCRRGDGVVVDLHHAAVVGGRVDLEGLDGHLLAEDLADLVHVEGQRAIRRRSGSAPADRSRSRPVFLAISSAMARASTLSFIVTPH